MKKNQSRKNITNFHFRYKVFFCLISLFPKWEAFLWSIIEEYVSLIYKFSNLATIFSSGLIFLDLQLNGTKK